MNTIFKISAVVITLFISRGALAQLDKNVIMTIDGDPIYTKEFVRVYKKNLELVQDESQKSIDGYLDLFIDYKLKIAEAYDQNLDESKNYVKEFAKYEDQLSRNYIYEDKVTTNLAEMAYERGKHELNVAHILVKTTYDNEPKDTLIAYNKIKKALDRARKGEDFGKLAGEYSEEPGAAKRGGDIGYFSTFSMVHQFEDEAYATPVGEISNIVRTQFGYHILKVKDKREKSAEITVSHIMILDKEDDARTFVPKERIEEIYQLLQQGETFESLAKQYSEDKNSAKNGGKLNRFGRGQLRSKEFETEVFALNNPGDMTAPFKTEFGWHIARLEQIHDTESFEDVKAELEKKVGTGARAKIVVAAVNDKIKEKFGFKRSPDYVSFFKEWVSDSILTKKWDYDADLPKLQETMLTIGKDRKVTYGEFAAFLKERQKVRALPKLKPRLIDEVYEVFETDVLKTYFRKDLEKTNDEYAAVITEYRDGLLIFDVMNYNIWQKSKLDTLGQKAYYANHKDDYKWSQRVDATIVTATDAGVANVVRTMLMKGDDVNAIKTALNKDNEVSVIASDGVIETDDDALPQGFELQEGVSKVYEQNKNYTVVKVKEIIEPTNKLYEEVKGKVMSDYQNETERTWMASLHKKYDVVLNKKALKKLKKQLSK